MKKIILIFIFIFSSSLFAEQGDLDVSLNFGVSSGTGFGLAYNLTDSSRIKFSGLLLIPNASEGMLYFAAASFNTDFSKLNDKISTSYFFISSSGFFAGERIYYAISSGVGIKKFIGDYLFCELEVGMGMYGKKGSNDYALMLSGGLNFGYRL